MTGCKLWFAWYPVRLYLRGWCWLRVVEWRRVRGYDFKRNRHKGYYNLYS